MPTPQKATTIEKATEKYQKATGVLFTEYRGLKVGELQALRKELSAKGADLQVIKNTLFKLAAGDDAEKLTEDLTSGPTAVAFVYENESDCAKVLMDFAKTHKNLVIKGGIIGGKVMDAQSVDNLSKLPPREVLIAQVIGAVAAPLSNLVGVIEALYADPIRVIGAVADKVQEESGSPAPAPKAEEKATEEAAAEAPAEAQVEASAETEAPAESNSAAEEAAPTQSQEEPNQE